MSGIFTKQYSTELHQEPNEVFRGDGAKRRKCRSNVVGPCVQRGKNEYVLPWLLVLCVPSFIPTSAHQQSSCERVRSSRFGSTVGNLGFHAQKCF